MAKRYDILRLPPQEKAVYFVVEAFLPDDLETTEYHYEEGSCPSDFFHRLEKIITDGDTDPHGLFEFVRTTEPLEFIEQAHYPDMEWPKVLPEAFSEAEACDLVVCGLAGDSSFTDNVFTSCAICGTAIMHRPYAPKKPLKVCMRCAVERAERGMPEAGGQG